MIREPALQVMETIRLHTLLGIRFQDAARGVQIRDGLAVTARAEGSNGKGVQAFSTASGAYAFQGLPGLRHSETGLRAPDDLDSPPQQRTFFVAVRDSQARFLPALFAVELPLPYRGLYRSEPDISLETSPPSVQSPPADDPQIGVPLYSAPTRGAVPGLAQIRADLWDLTVDGPASWARLAVSFRGQHWFGLADARGSLALYFPYPNFVRSLSAGSPPGLSPLQEWQVTIRVFSSVNARTPPAHQDLPLMSALRHQEPAQFQPDLNANAVSRLEETLRFDRGMTLRSSGQSVLFIVSDPTSP